MPESFFSKAKADGQVFVRTMSLATKLSKLKIEINKKHREKDRTLKQVGSKIVELYEQTHKIDADAIFAAVSDDLRAAQQLEQDVVALEAEIEQVKADFRTSSQSGVKVTTEPPPEAPPSNQAPPNQTPPAPGS